MPKERREIKRALQAKGFALQSQRDHDVYFFQHEGKTQPVYTKLSRGQKYRTIDDSLLDRMRKQLHLSKDEFERWVGCPLGQTEYLQILTQKGILKSAPG